MNAKRDGNRVASLIGVSSIDGETTVYVAVNPDTNRLLVESDDPLPTESNNPELELGYNAAGDLVRLRSTINSDTYEKTFSNADTTVTTTKTISPWSLI